MKKTVQSLGIQALCGLVMLGFGVVSQAQVPSRYAYSTDGKEVTDALSGLTWSRCTVGQDWTGTTCAGGLTSYTHEAALIFAATKTGWRIPNIKELGSLVDVSRVNPAIDMTAFPQTASVSYWSSTPNVQAPTSAWAVDFLTGTVASTTRTSAGVLLRLVK
jgi:hypothetical protein